MNAAKVRVQVWRLLTTTALACVALCSTIDKCKQHIVLHIDPRQGRSTRQHFLLVGSHNPLIFLTAVVIRRESRAHHRLDAGRAFHFLS